MKKIKESSEVNDICHDIASNFTGLIKALFHLTVYFFGKAKSKLVEHINARPVPAVIITFSVTTGVYFIFAIYSCIINRTGEMNHNKMTYELSQKIDSVKNVNSVEAERYAKQLYQNRIDSLEVELTLERQKHRSTRTWKRHSEPSVSSETDKPIVTPPAQTKVTDAKETTKQMK